MIRSNFIGQRFERAGVRDLETALQVPPWPLIEINPSNDEQGFHSTGSVQLYAQSTIAAKQATMMNKSIQVIAQALTSPRQPRAR